MMGKGGVQEKKNRTFPREKKARRKGKREGGRRAAREGGKVTVSLKLGGRGNGGTGERRERGT